jgi:hypothetical protein
MKYHFILVAGFITEELAKRSLLMLPQFELAR